MAYLQRPDHDQERVAIWLDESWLTADRDEPIPAPDLELSPDEMNSLLAQWLQGPIGPAGPVGPMGKPGYPLDIDLIERLEYLEKRIEEHEGRHELKRIAEETEQAAYARAGTSPPKGKGKSFFPDEAENVPSQEETQEHKVDE